MYYDVAVIIPYYHSDLSKAEELSLKQCLKVLSKYPIILLVPDNMEKEEYKHEEVMYEKVPAEWLASVAAYNEMMLNPDFYMRLNKYEYILIYQLDAFVFSDQLNRFCQYGFDYIGAPWLKGVKYYKDFSKCVWHVGNGGLSLRKVDSFIKILEKSEFENINFAEDVFWASCEGEGFHIAPVDVALQFAFECDADECYLLNGRHLPFGCHAWGKYDFDFWKPYLTEEGYDLGKENKSSLDSGKDYRYLEVDSTVIRKSCSQYLHCENKEIYIWGAGNWGEECGWLLIKCGMNRFHYVDSNQIKQLGTLWGISIESTETLIKQKRDNIVVIVAVKGKEKEILNLLESRGYYYKQDVFFYMDWINDFNVSDQ